MSAAPASRRPLSHRPPSHRPAASDHALDLLGFLLGIGLALAFGWKTTDLVWGLWLSSLVIGYATIVLGIAAAALRGQRTHGALGVIGGAVFLLAFFTVHFGMFHFVHSVFLGFFFPLDPQQRSEIVPGWHGYAHVFASYWPWLPAAAIAERRSLFAPLAPHRGDGSADAAVRFNPLQAYANVVRMHLLIFFFAATMLVGLDGFFVYATVYAVYFWPWRRGPRVLAAVADGGSTAAT